jgi:peroxiredoxin
MSPKIIFSLLGALGILLFHTISSAVAASPTVGKARLTGRIRKPTHDTIAVSVPAGLFDPHEHLTYARLNERGEFSLVVPLLASTKADLVYGDDAVDLYLDPGTDLDVRFQAKDMAATITFTPNDMPGGFLTKIHNGRNLTDAQRHRLQMANANEYLAEFDEQFVANDGFQVLPDNIFLYEASFQSFLDYRIEQEKDFLDDRAAKQSFTTDFYKYAKAEITYANLNDRLTFQDLREQVVSVEGRLNLSPAYYDFVRDPTPLSDFSAAQSEHYQEYLLNFIYFSAAQQRHLRTDPNFYSYCYALANKHLRGQPRLVTLGHILQESFRSGPIQQSAALLASYQALDTKRLFWPTLAADFNQHQALAIGTMAPDFCLPAVAGGTLSLSDFRGKLLYLNFWKSTSGPCIYDLPYLQDLAQRFEGQNVVFINVSLDDKEATWQQQVAQKKLPGVQLWAAGGYQSAAAVAYGLQTMPAYLLIGEDGTILNAKPKRPSSRAAVEEITQSFGKAARYRAAAVPVPGREAKPVFSMARKP